ncbi:unnamed protein product [Dovyalis caffra]|uniref:Homeobox-leucine zipper protein n=1 Tax=Dovyalis caffra TaxID=77055 RepID=A0AAV1QR84_9ROSI|nr:unnamed protein product [Dovyalis caffra]
MAMHIRKAQEGGRPTIPKLIEKPYKCATSLLVYRILTFHNKNYQIQMEGIEDFDQAAAGDHSEVAESFACLDDDQQQQQLQQIPRRKKKKGGKNTTTKRFSDEQVRSLESMFESETKLESRKKMQLARELGLQPRQVAIWFQNRRARWKTKQIEQEYKTLKANYDNLASSYESLKNERESLVSQLQKLSDLLGHPYVCDGGLASVLHEGNPKLEAETQQGLDNTVIPNMCEDKSRENGDEGQGFLNRGSSEYSDETLASVYEKLYSSDSGGQLDLSWSSAHWFNFWT